MWADAQHGGTAVLRSGGMAGDATRHRYLMRAAKVICASGEYPCILLDVSESGARVRLFHDAPPHPEMLIELSNGEIYAAEQRWADGDAIGLAFTSPVDVAEFVSESHRFARRPLRLRTRVELPWVAAGTRGHGVLDNLSAGGACIETGLEVAVGTALRVEIPGHGPRVGAVCWRSDYRHGVSFQNDMAMSEFAQLARALQPFERRVRHDGHWRDCLAASA